MNWPITNPLAQHTPDLRRIYQQARQVAFPWLDPASFQLADFDQVTQDERLLVATSQLAPIGFIAWWPPDQFIHSLFVDPQFIRRGVGRSLLQACLAQIGRPAKLKCQAANHNALAFYASQGWLPVHRAQDADGPYWLLTLDQ